MKRFDIEMAAGIFLLIGILALGYISVKLGKLEPVIGRGYTVFAEFEKAGGIKPGAVVEISGVEVGKVKSVSLSENYQARVEVLIFKNIILQEDSIASIKTKGIIGEKYVSIAPGGSDKLISHGGKIRETESAIDLEEIMSKYVFGEV